MKASIAKYNSSVAVLDDGLPSHGYLRCDQVLKAIPISKSLFWKIVKDKGVPRRKCSPRTTLFLVADIRKFFLTADPE